MKLVWENLYLLLLHIIHKFDIYIISERQPAKHI